MKILAPINTLKEAEKVIDAGTDEIYCGIIDKDLTPKYKIAFINRRPFDECNLSSFDELRRIVEYSHKRNVQVNITLNEPMYTDQQFDYIKYNLEVFCHIGVDAVIVSDLGLVNYIKEKGYKIKIHISTCASIYNAEGVKFCKKYGASRIILPRHMTTQEINSLISVNKDIEYEAIILNTKCQNDDGYCTYDHSLGNYTNDSCFVGGGCGNLNEIKTFIKNGVSSELLVDFEGEYRRRQRTFHRSCGACSMKQLSKAGVNVLKIVGREYSTERKIKDVIFINKVRAHLENLDKENNFNEIIKGEYLKIYDRECKDGCYY